MPPLKGEVLAAQAVGFTDADLGRSNQWRPTVVDRMRGSNRNRALPGGSKWVQAQPAIVHEKVKRMKTEVKKPDAAALREAGRLIREGSLVGFPTETVYGLGANALDEIAVHSIFEAKGRPGDNPLIVHVSCME